MPCWPSPRAIAAKLDLKLMESRSLLERFRERVKQGNADDCWPWAGTLRKDGYGVLSECGHQGRLVRVHRLAYELEIGPIPAGLTIDHLCRNRRCCNPAHMEAVSIRENVLRGESLRAQEARQTHCLRGYELAGENIYQRKDRTGRYCRICRRIRRQET